jgi:CBS domain-containing protein
MRISDICTRHVFDITASASVEEAAQRMRKCHVGALVVVDGSNHQRIPMGVITDRDIVIEVVAVNIAANTLSVKDIMSSKLATCGETDDLLQAIQLMRNRGVRRLPVVDGIGSLVGMVTADDIVGGITRELNDLSGALVREQVREMQERPG